jgi:hypothetical protein
MIASDYQESKNVNTIGTNLMPNTAFTRQRIRVGAGPTLTWVLPNAGACAAKNTRVLVVGSDTRKISSVQFFDGSHKFATVERNVAGLFPATWRTSRAAKGRHTLRAVLTDSAGRHARAKRVLRVCGKNS